MDWSGLLPDILVDIALRLPLMEDFTAFRGVCSNWRAAGSVKRELFKGLGKVPLLMLSEKDNESDEREFYSFSRNKIFTRMPVPRAKDQRCMDAGFGWILAISPSSVGEISLFNPFSSAAKIELPNFQTFPEYEECQTCPEVCFIQQGILSDDPLVTSNFTVFVIVNFALGFWRNGDKRWTKVDGGIGETGSLCYYKRKLYAVNIYGDLFRWGTDPTIARVIALWQKKGKTDWMPYLVESSNGELLIILRDNYEFSEIGATRFEVMRVDLVKMECEKINSIGTDAVFIGHNATVSIAAAGFPGVLKPNCIYFTDDCWATYTDEDYSEKGGGTDMGIYSVEDGCIERFDVESFSRVSPPLWVFPSF